MLKSISVLFTIIVTSLYFFPFDATFLPGMNTKMLVAAFGLVVFGVNLAQARNASGNRDFMTLSFFGGLVSLIGFISVVINATPDYTYASYIVSMWVWLGGAYAVTRLIKGVHGYLSVRLVCHYLIAVCVMQCVIAIAMSQYPPLKATVDSLLGSGGFMGKVEGRLYGLGASLDVAGMRFAAVLTIIAYLCTDSSRELSPKTIVYYILSFLVITLIGNMIGRSATIGMVFALGYWLLVSLILKDEGKQKNIRTMWTYLIGLLIVCLPVVVFLYHTNPGIHKNIRFAFEGFFSLWERGRWEVHSNEILKYMFIFPDNAKTWIIGDGYFDNPAFTDPYYTGPQWFGFYQDTDVGYLRFIFYFGVTGLCSFILYMGKVAHVCIRRFENYRWLFLMLITINYLVWFKVSSDLFLVFALFLCVSKEEETCTAHAVE